MAQVDSPRPDPAGTPVYYGQSQSGPATRPDPMKSLVELAIASASIGIKAILWKEDLWSMLPIHIIQRVYEGIERRGNLSTGPWQLLARMMTKEKQISLERYYVEVSIELDANRQESDVQDFKLGLIPIPTPTLDFITSLVITDSCRLRREELLHLASMKNLGTLKISEPDILTRTGPRLTDRLIRSWSEMDDPFPILRILQLSGTEVTPQCFRYLSRFPSLVYLAVHGRKAEWSEANYTAAQSGWRLNGSPDGVQTLLLRYFGSCLGWARDVPREAQIAARLISRGKPADYTRLLPGEKDRVLKFGGGGSVAPWRGSVPDNAKDVRGTDGLLKDGQGWGMHDNPTWWLYLALGRVLFADGDLRARNAEIGDVLPSVGVWALPPLPMVAVTMRAGGEDTGGGSVAASIPLFSERKKYRFVRKDVFDGIEKREPGWPPPRGGRESKVEGQVEGRGSKDKIQQPQPRPRKRQKMGDLLSSLRG